MKWWNSNGKSKEINELSGLNCTKNRKWTVKIQCIMKMRQSRDEKKINTDWQTDRQADSLSHFNEMTLLIYLLSCVSFLSFVLGGNEKWCIYDRQNAILFRSLWRTMSRMMLQIFQLYLRNEWWFNIRDE